VSAGAAAQTPQPQFSSPGNDYSRRFSTTDLSGHFQPNSHNRPRIPSVRREQLGLAAQFSGGGGGGVADLVDAPFMERRPTARVSAASVTPYADLDLARLGGR
jgi:hypothetical protein